jgi:hypothetical protein
MLACLLSFLSGFTSLVLLLAAGLVASEQTTPVVTTQQKQQPFELVCVCLQGMMWADMHTHTSVAFDFAEGPRQACIVQSLLPEGAFLAFQLSCLRWHVFLHAFGGRRLLVWHIFSGCL